MGEEVCASVIVKEGATITEADIKAYSKGKVCFWVGACFLFDRTTADSPQRYTPLNFRFCIFFQISHFKIPKYIFIEKDGFPMTATGKVQKNRLREIAMQRIASIAT